MRPMNPVIKELAREMGQQPYAIRKWKMRGAVPHMHRLPLLQLAEKRGKRLSVKDFDFKKRAPKHRVRPS